MKPCPGYLDPWSPVEVPVVSLPVVPLPVVQAPVVSLPVVQAPVVPVPVVPAPVAVVCPPDTTVPHPESATIANAHVQRIVETVAIVSPPGGR
jgi:hypothetical protein